VGQNEGQFALFIMPIMLKCLWQKTSQWLMFEFLPVEELWCLQVLTQILPCSPILS